MHFLFHPNSDNIPGRVQRRADRYEQSDTRGQYPRPRNNEFAQQPKPRVFPTPQARIQQPAPSPEADSEPQDVFTDHGAQYVKPARPYVPGYMRSDQQRQPPPQGFDQLTPQAGAVPGQTQYTVISEKNGEPKPKMSRRTQLVLIAVAAVVLAGVWIGQMLFSAQTQSIFAAREAQAQSIANKHPYSYRELIEREAYKNNLNPAFVAAIVLNESSFDPYAESYKGARGLMQMMEDTALWVSQNIGSGGEYAFDQMYDAETNVTFGCWYLAYLSDKFGGDPVLVAAAFHSGQTNVSNWLSNAQYSSDQRTIKLENLPDGNTKTYVERVLNAFAVYRRLYYEEVTV
ncbi:MAG TPA: transglycosylase SLT domain-containing protein [Candidatus Limiplasma sp.]|nr:transglycosylase SLT domain-containing protein [Candidatus Limiplasma sp.]HRX09158.1 transglycosylase SLT domain-containing protein [Candidatus Limiplasma sp.]